MPQVFPTAPSSSIVYTWASKGVSLSSVVDSMTELGAFEFGYFGPPEIQLRAHVCHIKIGGILPTMAFPKRRSHRPQK